MSFRAIFPLVDFKEEFNFENCNSNEEFLSEIVKLYFAATELRVQEATLAVYMAYRDHYPKYLVAITQDQIKNLNADIEKASGKIIKLRRIALSALCKVA